MKKHTLKQAAESRNSIAQRLVEQYLAGHDSDTGFILDVLNLQDRRTIDEVLEIMPRALLKRLDDFVDHYTPDTRVFNGPSPNMQTIKMVRRLLGKRNGALKDQPSRPAIITRRDKKPNK